MGSTFRTKVGVTGEGPYPRRGSVDEPPVTPEERQSGTGQTTGVSCRSRTGERSGSRALPQ